MLLTTTTEPVFLYDLIDQTTGRVLDTRWLSKSERDRHRELSSTQVWAEVKGVQPRWEVGYLIQAICSFYWVSGLDQFKAAIANVVPKDASPQRIERLYQQYAECASKLICIRPEVLAAVAMSYLKQLEQEAAASQGGSLKIAAAGLPGSQHHRTAQQQE